MKAQVRMFKESSIAHFQVKRREAYVSFNAEVSDAMDATINLAEGTLPSMHPKSSEKSYIECDLEQSGEEMIVKIGDQSFKCKDLFTLIPITPLSAYKASISVEELFT